MAYQLGTRAYGSASITGAKIASDTIVNANVKSDAAIALTKLATVTASKALVSDGSGYVSASSVTATELGYLSGVTSSIQTQISALESGYSRRRAVIDYITDNTAAPLTENNSDRYLLAVNGGAPHADYDGASAGDIVEFNGSVWVATPPVEGYVVYDDDSNYDYLYTNDGTPAWEARAVISTALADGKIWVGNGSGVATPVTPSGDVTISNAGVTAIGSEVIVNADISTSAAIALSKLAAGTDGYIIVCAETTGVPTYVAMSGDVTISNTGATTIGATKVTNSMLAGSIEDSKLSTIATSNKVSGSAVQLNAAGGLENNTGLQINVDATNGTTKLNASNELEGLKPYTETFTLTAQNITDQYIDLAKLIYAGSLSAIIESLPTPRIGTQLTTSIEGGVTRVTFADALATAGAAALVEGDIIQVYYTSLS